jgi:hypothetical protein
VGEHPEDRLFFGNLKIWLSARAVRTADANHVRLKLLSLQTGRFSQELHRRFLSRYVLGCRDAPNRLGDDAIVWDGEMKI